MLTPRRVTLALLAVSLCQIPTVDAIAQVAEVNEQKAAGNKPERLEWFERLGFGMFIHWNVDSQLGSVISHSLVGADEHYCRRYFEELPRSFNPKRFDPDDIAALAKLAGMKYVVFTAKHHSGFCMFDTETTDFNVMNTPYGRDITAELIDALRRHGVVVGLYFSPDDFHYLWKHDVTIGRRRQGVTPQELPGLMEYDRAQLRELLTGYGPIDIIFLDGPAAGLRELCWELQPNIVVTRGAMETPEQHIPGKPIPGPWEACMTIGTQWNFKPTNETYKSGGAVIERLIETRAKGGNLLMNIGPQPDGVIPFEQQRRLREVALWMFINDRAIYDVRPWRVTHEGDVWYTQSRQGDTVYAFLTGEPWPWGQRREITLKSIAAGPETQVSILGQTGQVLEYQPDADPACRWEQTTAGLRISAVRAQRIYNDRSWPNPLVLRITDAKPAEKP